MDVCGNDHYRTLRPCWTGKVTTYPRRWSRTRVVTTVGNDGDLAPWWCSMPKKQCIAVATKGIKAGRKRKRVQVKMKVFS